MTPNNAASVFLQIDVDDKEHYWLACPVEVIRSTALHLTLLWSSEKCATNTEFEIWHC